MTNMKTLIEREFDAFFEFETDNRDVVTSTSAKLFAEHVVGIATAPESPAVPTQSAKRRPSDGQIIATLMYTYDADRATVIEWIACMDLEEVA